MQKPIKPSDFISALQLSPQIQNALQIGHIFTVGDLVECSVDDLRNINRIGLKSISEIQDKLLKHKFCLKPVIPSSAFSK